MGHGDGVAMSAGDIFTEQFDPYAHAATTDRTILLEVELALIHRNPPGGQTKAPFCAGLVTALNRNLIGVG